MQRNGSYHQRTDSVDEKLQLLKQAHAEGNYDLAMSLCESLKDTLNIDQQSHGKLPSPTLAADRFWSVASLPAPWRQWASGWKFFKPLALFETLGLQRISEPMDVTVALQANQTDDPHREIRLARLDESTGKLQEVPCQIYGEVRRGQVRIFQVVFMADVPMHERAVYLLLFGNPNAELPNYTTDLRVQGEGYGLRIENRHFTAQLSQQMGQLERITYQHQHGLELYAGGKGHGEPPGIDWAHDYVDEGNFQKLRMRNWPQCPNYQVVQGPLCVQVRRWGFPASPIHPVFSPARLHMDQTYTFYAGLPYFFKQGETQAVKQVRIEAMRDDEWVFSGYSFTDTLWIDRRGKLQEGTVPAQDANDLWGVGFFHRASRDAFVALWLDHSARHFDALQHSGSPTLHYDGHGQLWSRYPARNTTLEPGTTFLQRNAYLIFQWPEHDAAGAIENLRHRLTTPLEVQSIDPPSHRSPQASGTLARLGESEQDGAWKRAIWDALARVQDEQLYEIDANIVDMGYVYDVRARNGTVQVLVTMPHRGRPVYQFLVSQGGGRVSEGIRERLLRLDGVDQVVVDFTWNPPWTTARMTENGRQAVGI